MRPIDADALIEVVEKSMAENPHKEKMQRAMHIHEHKYFLTLLAGTPIIQPEKAQLSQEGTTSDLISRQEAIDALDCLATEVDENGDELFLKDEAYHVIEVLPTIQPEPHDGRFERKQDGVFCSVCHYGWEFITGVPAEVEREYHYCPNCGARMKGESNETDRVD